MEYATTSYLDKQMSPVGRIYRLWFAMFAVRYWMYWMLNETYPLAKHIFTSNAYQCLEVNAHSLVLIELRIQELELAELFLPLSLIANSAKHPSKP